LEVSVKRLLSLVILGMSATLAASLLLVGAPSPQPAQAAGMGNAKMGAKIFAARCVMCHGVAGMGGGIGPVLKGEKKRKNFTQAVVWIKNPKAPMPKYYPSVLSATDVNNVAAYVESL
jgi:mono/diheme cytochrome c family protein